MKVRGRDQLLQVAGEGGGRCYEWRRTDYSRYHGKLSPLNYRT